MTEAEKAAAAKAEAEAKAKAEAEKAAAEKKTDTTDEEEKPDDKPMTRAEFEAFKTKANKEAEKHRLRAKEAEAKFEGLQKSLAGALGVKPTEDGSTGAPSLEVVTKAAEAKQRNLLLRSEFVALAAQEGAADPRDAFELARSSLADVSVDLDAESVDVEALREKIQGLKKSKPYMFAKANDGTSSGGGKPPGKTPDGSGTPATGGTAYQQWQALEKAGRRLEATAFYGKNREAIRNTWPK